jgi:protein Mpv17
VDVPRRTDALSLALSSPLATIDVFWRTYPYAAAALTCGFKASAADFVAQKRQMSKAEKERNQQKDDEMLLPSSDKNGSDPSSLSSEAVDTAVISTTTTTSTATDTMKIDKLRNFAYLVYGALYQGMAQEYIYNHLYPVMFGTGTDPVTVLSKVLFDLLVQTTLVTLPIAYISKAIIFRYGLGEAFRRYLDDIKNHGLLKKYFALWGPVQCLTFSIVPEHFRVTFIAAVSFFWLIILSSIASKARPPRISSDAGGGASIPVKDDCPLEDGQTCQVEWRED